MKVLESAIANARVKADRESVAFDERDLVIEAAFVDEGPTMKRFRPRAQGRASRINKRAEPHHGGRRAAREGRRAGKSASAKKTTNKGGAR